MPGWMKPCAARRKSPVTRMADARPAGPWKKLGHLFSPDGTLVWCRSHASLPTPVHLGGDVFRVFFSGRDGDNRSHIGFVDLELGASPRITDVAQEPVLAPAPTGSFDDRGTTMGAIVRAGDGDHLYYMGWNVGAGAPWRNSIGLARGDARAGQFTRYAPGPILDRSPDDPYTLTYPWVMRNGDDWHMWYGSSLTWGSDVEGTNHIIRHAVSRNGIDWHRGAEIVIGSQSEVELLTRPCVVRDADLWRMWYAYRRGGDYRLGFAQSKDGRNWKRRDDEAGLDVSPSGWDSEMICYPCVFDHKGMRYMLYNGNRYGATGFGLAVQDSA